MLAGAFVSSGGSVIVGGRSRFTVACNFSYNASATTTILYPRLTIGTGSDASPTSSTAQGFVAGPVAMRLRRAVLTCSASAGSTAISLVGSADYTSYAAIDSATLNLAAGVNDVDFLALAGPHTIPAGHIIALGIDPTTTPGFVVGTLLFESVN